MRTTISGTKVTGRGDGTRLGFPTINLDTHTIRPDLYGVWFSYCHAGTYVDIPSITHIGPSTLFGQYRATVEVYILDWDDAYENAAYGVELLAMHRNTKEIQSEDVLIQEITADIVAANAFFKDYTSTFS